MGAWQVAVTDLNQLTRAFVSDYDAVQITPNLNGYRELSMVVDPLDDSALELLVAERAIKVWDDQGAIRFNGQIWEPLERTSTGIKVVARGPFATFSWRRVRVATDYTATNNAGGPWDAAAIFADRITVQNGYRTTYLRMGAAPPASTNRLRHYDPGYREDDAVAQLVNAAGGFFFVEQPLDGVAGYMGEIQVKYPAAGVSHDDVRFEWGVGTIDNCVDYSLQATLPRTRYVASSSDATNTRIAGAAEDAAAIARYGLFEDESGFSDVVDIALLQQQAQGALMPVAPTTISMTPGIDAPVLFQDFNVGDFVRAKIVHGGFSFFGWVRVDAATVSVDKDGLVATSAITLEILTGGKPQVDPEIAWYEQLDETRRRLEALERNAQIASAPPTPSGGGSDAPPPDPVPVESAPPPAPPSPPTISSFAASGQWDASGSPYALGVATVDGHGQATVVWLEVVGQSSSPQTSVGTGGSATLKVSGLTANTTYTVILHAKNSAGEVTQTTSITTPRVRSF